MERPTPQLETQRETTGKRVQAWLVDSVLLSAVSIPIVWLIDDLTAIVWVWAFASFGYHTVFEAVYGQTFGKKALNIVVVKENGDDCDWVAAAIRNLVRVVDAFLFYLVGLALILVTDNNQRLGDVVASTVVMKVSTEPEPKPEPQPKPEPGPSDFVIELHQDDIGGDRYIELVNQCGQEVDLSRATLRTATGDEFRFPQGEAVHNPGDSKTFRIPEDFALEPDASLTLLTYMNERYEVRWS